MINILKPYENELELLKEFDSILDRIKKARSEYAQIEAMYISGKYIIY